MNNNRPTLSIFREGAAASGVPEKKSVPLSGPEAEQAARRVALPPLPGARAVRTNKPTPVKAKHAWAESQLREAMRDVGRDTIGKEDVGAA